MDQFRYFKIQPKTIDLGTRLWGINTEFVVACVGSVSVKQSEERGFRRFASEKNGARAKNRSNRTETLATQAKFVGFIPQSLMLVSIILG